MSFELNDSLIGHAPIINSNKWKKSLFFMHKSYILILEHIRLTKCEPIVKKAKHKWHKNTVRSNGLGINDTTEEKNETLTLSNQNNQLFATKRQINSTTTKNTAIKHQLPLIFRLFLHSSLVIIVSSMYQNRITFCCF